jgi:hypothetical protein
METNLHSPSDISTAQFSPSASQQKICFVPVHKVDLPYWDKKGIKYLITDQPCVCLDMIMVEVEIVDGFDIAMFIHLGKMISRENMGRALNKLSGGHAA